MKNGDDDEPHMISSSVFLGGGEIKKVHVKNRALFGFLKRERICCKFCLVFYRLTCLSTCINSYMEEK